MKYTTLFVTAISSLALVGAGCAPGPEVQLPPPSTSKVPAHNIVLNEVALPNDFPRDVVRYENSKVFSFIYDAESPDQAVLSLTSGDESMTVLQWYDEKYVQDGFTRGQSASQGDVTSHEFLKGNIVIVVNVIDQSSTNQTDKSLISVTRRVNIIE